jgi:hypothetical protein
MASNDAESAFNDAESVFRMKPAAAIEALARAFVASQMAIAKVRDMIDALPADDPRADDIRAQAAAAIQNAADNGVPHHAAALRLALEVLDTYGPDGVDFEDAFDASVWNNKYFVWLKEFGGRPPEASG